MSEFTTGEARERFAEVVNRVAYGKDRVILTRRGKQIAAVVPIEDLEALRSAEGEGSASGREEDSRDSVVIETPEAAAAREKLRRLAQTPGHTESLAGIGRPLARRWPAPDEDWDAAVARAAGEDFLRKISEE